MASARYNQDVTPREALTLRMMASWLMDHPDATEADITAASLRAEFVAQGSDLKDDEWDMAEFLEVAR